MDTPHIEEVYFLERDGCKYRGIAFDGCHFYLTAKNTICVFDLSMRRLNQIKTCQCFTSICYDPCLNCFWALAENSHYAYCLDCMLREIDRIELPHHFGKQMGISCGKNDGELLIAAGESLYCIAKSGCMNAYKINSMPGAIFQCVSSADKGYISSGIFNYGSTIRKFTYHEASCEMSCGIILPKGYAPVDMTCGRCCHENFLLTVKDNCYFRIIRCFAENCKCCDTCFRTDDICNSCQEIYCDPCQEVLCNPCCDPHCTPCCESHCTPCCEPHCTPCCESHCTPCCEPHCTPCCEPHCTPCCEPQCTSCCKPHSNLCCPSHCKALCCRKHCKDKDQELHDIIESIALSETALSHILNAEGEKLQKILELSHEPETLLETNKSISATISKVTHLEYVLFEKLRIIQEMSECNKEKTKECKSHCC